MYTTLILHEETGENFLRIGYCFRRSYHSNCVVEHQEVTKLDVELALAEAGSAGLDFKE